MSDITPVWIDPSDELDEFDSIDEPEDVIEFPVSDPAEWHINCVTAVITKDYLYWEGFIPYTDIVVQTQTIPWARIEEIARGPINN